MLVTIDFETFYDKKYSLGKLTTEAYIRDPRFQVIGCAIKIDDNKARWFTGAAVAPALHSLALEDNFCLAHNAMFDCAILNWHYGIRPRLIVDTMSMARPHHGITEGVSLDALATYYKIGTKLNTVRDALGKRLEDFTPEELQEYGVYATNDADLCYALFKKLRPMTSNLELRVIDTTVRMFTEPALVLDKSLLEQHRTETLEVKERLFGKLDSEDARATIMSNEKFAEHLRGLGVEPPTKVSVTTGKLTYAFAKTDKGFTALAQHPDEQVRNAVAARLGGKSTLNETRASSLIEIAERGPLPVPLKYWAAHTGRYGGQDLINLQNLPRGGALRRAIQAPEGHSIVAADLSQIEARILAVVAGQDDLVKAFRDKRDVYSEFASELYNRTITKADKVERFVGKTCLAGDTMVLTGSGWKPIKSIDKLDLVWDGTAWVRHRGLVYQGVRDTVNLLGVNVTPDHEILVRKHWLPVSDIVQNQGFLHLALATGEEALSSLDLDTEEPLQEGLSRRSLLTATAGIAAAPFLLKNSLPGLRTLGYATPAFGYGYNTLGLPLPAGADYSIGLEPRSHAQLTQTTQAIATTELEGSASTLDGETTRQPSLSMSRRSPGGTTPASNLTEKMLTEITPQETYDSYREKIIAETNEKLLTLRRRLEVYDLASCGPRQRFMILTDAGPLIVHNCTLGLGYGMGALKLRETLRIGNGGISVAVEHDEAEHMVQVYRTKNHMIKYLWRRGDFALRGMLSGWESMVDEFRYATYSGNKVLLSPGGFLRYPGLHKDQITGELLYYNRQKPTKIYGGLLTENIVQALARQVIVEHLVAIRAAGYRVVLQVHDEIVCIVPDDRVDSARLTIETIMSAPPIWMPTLPVACELGVGKSYGDAK